MQWVVWKGILKASEQRPKVVKKPSRGNLRDCSSRAKCRSTLCVSCSVETLSFHLLLRKLISLKQSAAIFLSITTFHADPPQNLLV